MISCQDADVIAAALAVGSIDVEDQSPLQQHLGECAECRRGAGEYLAAAARLPLALEPLQPSPELRGRLMRAVYAEAEEAGRRVTAAETTPRRRRLWTGLPAARGFAVLAAAAAVVLIAVTSWALINRQSDGPSVVVGLAATSSAPQARGQLMYDRGGSQAVLTVTGLPAPATIAAGAGVYEVWLVRPDGAAVAAAYLSHEPDGTWGAALSGDMSTYSMVAATVEPPGGSIAPAGVRVIQATLNNP